MIGNALAVPFQDAVFDTAMCTGVIEHVPKPWVVLHELYRVLKEGGYLLLFAPFLYPYDAERKNCLRYTSEGLCALLEDANSTIITIRPMVEKNWYSLSVSIA